MSWRELDVMESTGGVRGWGQKSGAISDAQALWQTDGGDACIGDISVNREEGWGPSLTWEWESSQQSWVTGSEEDENQVQGMLVSKGKKCSSKGENVKWYWEVKVDED
jgi:hypothetical protein